jgi:hypothetical protein
LNQTCDLAGAGVNQAAGRQLAIAALEQGLFLYMILSHVIELIIIVMELIGLHSGHNNLTLDVSLFHLFNPFF